MNTEQEKKILTDEELDAIVDAAEEASKDVEVDIRKIKEETKVDLEAELEYGTLLNDFSIGEGSYLSSDKKPDLDVSSESIFDIDGENTNTEKDEKITYQALANSSAGSNLDDDEIYSLLNTIEAYRNDKTIDVYPMLPEKIRATIREVAISGGYTEKKYPEIARYVLEEFINDASYEQAFVDIQQSLDSALNIPSVVDLYSDHMREVMEVKIPEVSEKIKDEDPEKAEELLKIKEAFTNAYTFKYAREMYESNSRIRKTVRRCNDRELKLAIRNFNSRNKDTKFIMNDANEVAIVLTDILHIQPHIVEEAYKKNRVELPEDCKKIIDMNLMPDDIAKFSILIFSSCNTLNANDLIDASYMYYLLKNIVTLKHTTESKTKFAAELINNICDTILYIRNKEAEFYAEHMDESKPRKKPRKKDGSRK